MSANDEIELSPYGYIPSLGPNIAGIVLFGFIWGVQTIFGFRARHWWWIVTWFFGSGLEVGGYIARVSNHYDVMDNGSFTTQVCTLIIAPAFYMAGIYYLLAQFIMVFGQKHSFLRPMQYSAIFITCDVISLIIQGAGGGMASSASDNGESVAPGSNVMLGGIAFQVVVMFVFMFLYGWFFVKVRRAKTRGGGSWIDNVEFPAAYKQLRSRKTFLYFPVAVFWSCLFIFIRCVYRIAELKEGWSGYLMTHERYFLVLDGLMVFFGTFILTVYHPSLAMGRAVIPVDGLHKRKYFSKAEERKDSPREPYTDDNELVRYERNV